MKDRLAAIAALSLVVVAMVAGALYRRKGVQRSPEDVVSAAFSAARDGDVRAYLACFSGDLRETLQSGVADVGKTAFGCSLQDRTRQVAGMALSRSGRHTGVTTMCILEVETVFQDRNECQEYRMERGRGGWRIAAIGHAAALEMPVSYGTRVVPDLPEATPPDGDASPP